MNEGEAEFVFDLEGMLETHPAMQRDVRVFLEALCHHNPTVERRICALLGARIMAQRGHPTGGNNAAYMAALEWLQAQAQGMTLIDTEGMMQKGLEESGPGGGAQ